jgi:hypothetical protein
MEYVDMDGRPRGLPFNEADYDDEDEEADPAETEDALTYEDFENIINTEGTTNSDVTELRKANFIRKGTAAD